VGRGGPAIPVPGGGDGGIVGCIVLTCVQDGHLMDWGWGEGMILSGVLQAGQFITIGCTLEKLTFIPPFLKSNYLILPHYNSVPTPPPNPFM